MSTHGEVHDHRSSKKGTSIAIKNSTRDLRFASDRRGSDSDSGLEDMEHLCGPCFRDEHCEKKKSEFYCFECADYLCTECKRAHRKIKISSNHQIVPSEEGSESSKQRSISEKCPDHSGKSLDYFCEGHKVACCKSCVDISHGQCEDVRFIPDEIIHMNEHEDLDVAKNDLEILMLRVKDITKKKQSLISRTNQQETDAVERVNALETVAVGLITKLAEEAVQEITKTGLNLSSKLQSDIDTCEAASSALENLENKLKLASQSQSKHQIYIACKNASQKIETYSRFVTETEDNHVESDIIFSTDRCFEAMLHNLSAIGCVVVNEPGSPLPSPILSPRPSPSPSRSSLVRRKAIPIGGQSVRINDDRSTCNISGCKFLPDGRIVLADYNNQCIKLFNANFKLVNYVRLASRPVDLIVLPTGRINEVGTSLPDENVLQYVKIGNTAFIGKRVATQAQYTGLAFSQSNNIFASCSIREDSGQIHVLDTEATVLRTIDCAFSSRPLLVRPTSLHVDDERNCLYVTDLGKQSVLCLDTNPDLTVIHQPLCTYSDRNLEPRGMLTADEEGCIYVSSGNGSVHQMSTHCEKICEILTSTDGLGQPHCLAYSAKDGLLLVSEFRENSVKLFKIN